MTSLGFPSSANGKEPTCNAGNIRDADSVLGLGRSTEGGHGIPLQYFYIESSMEKAMAPHSSTLAWRIPWMEEPGGLQFMGS